MQQQGVSTWDQRQPGVKTEEGIGSKTLKILRELFDKPFMPTTGSVLELGCGTGPVLRWMCRKGFTGLGVDISPTAIQMARTLSEGIDVSFQHGDVCAMPLTGRFDLIIDGHCLHCITDSHDRRIILNNVVGALNENGCFLVMSMCGPVNLALLQQQMSGQVFADDTIYVPMPSALAYQGARQFNGTPHIPTRHIAEWREVVAEVESAGLHCWYAQFEHPAADDLCGTFIGAFKPVR